MSENIMLSICVPAYNHEKYIAETLDSILMQETEYSYEVLVGEDASPDNTKQILQAYEEKYPGVFQMFYWEENLAKRNLSNSWELKKRTKGKYVITLEGDDFWTDKHKIQKQIDYLEAHPECIAVAHNCMVVDGDSKPKAETYPDCRHENYRLFDYLCEIMPGQTATVMYRNIYQDPGVDTSILRKGLSPGDRLLYIVLLINGKIHCMQETMSAYRRVTTSGTSYSATLRYSFQKEEHWYSQVLSYCRNFGAKFQIAAETHYLVAITRGLKMKAISGKEALSCGKRLKYKLPALLLYLVRYVQIHLHHTGN